MASSKEASLSSSYRLLGTYQNRPAFRSWNHYVPCADPWPNGQMKAEALIIAHARPGSIGASHGIALIRGSVFHWLSLVRDPGQALPGSGVCQLLPKLE